MGLADSLNILTYIFASIANQWIELKFKNEQYTENLDLNLSFQQSYWLIIACITWNSNLVPLLEGLCSSNSCRFEFSVPDYLSWSNERNINSDHKELSAKLLDYFLRSNYEKARENMAGIEFYGQQP